MQHQSAHNTQGERPYRSHLRPACVPCRRRKSRCQSDASSAICLMCRAHGSVCVFPDDSRDSQGPSHKPANATSRRQRRESIRSRTAVPSSAPSSSPFRLAVDPRAPAPSSHSHSSPSHALGRQRTASMTSNTLSGRNHQLLNEDEPSPLAFDSADDHALNLHIVGPAGTGDSQVLSDYLSAIPGATRGTRMVIPVPASRSRPILFTRVRKQPVGVKVNRSPAAEKLEVIEKLLEPHIPDVIDLYFKKANPCFPILDESSFRRQFTGDKDRISPALLASLYAHALIYWRYSPTLSSHRCPDSRFIWNLANEALYSELNLSPGMSIIKAIVLNITGRPTTSLIGNGVLLGSAVSMGHSLGLNHNPIPWEIPQPEKSLRMKLWWSLLIDDRWVSLAHGTPPHISRNQYDVPAPTLEYLGESPDSSHTGAASVFIALCRLTDVLDQHLQYIYHVGKDKTLNTTNLELVLNSWVESLSGAVRLIIIRGSHLDIPGASNLRLCYLTVRLLQQRIVLESEKQLHPTLDDQLLNRYIQARRTSEDILILTQELEPEQLGDFWLSISAFTYPTTINFLLRCALETENSPSGVAQSPSFRIARDIIAILRSNQEKHSWDLGDVCLAQHAEVVEKILTSVTSQEQGSNDTFDVHDFVLPDASIIDQFFPSLWDPLQNAW